MDKKPVLHICMGTGCHQLGVHDVLTQLVALLREEGLEDAVELKGTFCMNNCNQAIFVQLDDDVFGHIRPNNIERIYREEIGPRISGDKTSRLSTAGGPCTH